MYNTPYPHVSLTHQFSPQQYNVPLHKAQVKECNVAVEGFKQEPLYIQSVLVVGGRAMVLSVCEARSYAGVDLRRIVSSICG